MQASKKDNQLSEIIAALLKTVPTFKNSYTYLLS